MTARPSDPPHGAPEAAVVTARVDGTERRVVVALGDHGDPGPVLARLRAELGTTDLVVDRSGVALRGAVIGRDLLTGDRLVPAAERTLPALAGLAGPLQGAWATVDRELHLGRGGRFGEATITDVEVSRDHLRIWPTPGALLAVDVGSTNGTTRNGEPLVGPVPLRSGDLLELGSSILVVLGDPPRGRHLRPSGSSICLVGQDRAADGMDLAAAAGAIAGWSPGLWSHPLPPAEGVRLGASAHGVASLDLQAHRRIAVSGPPALVARHLAAWVLMLAARHPPDRLAVTVDLDGDPTTEELAESVRWLPHHRGAEAPGAPPAPWELAIVGHRRSTDAEAAAPARPGVHRTIVSVVAAGGPAPDDGAVVVALDDGGQATLRTTGGGAADLAFVADQVAPTTFAALARLLAPLCTQPPPVSS